MDPLAILQGPKSNPDNEAFCSLWPTKLSRHASGTLGAGNPALNVAHVLLILDRSSQTMEIAGFVCQVRYIINTVCWINDR